MIYRNSLRPSTRFGLVLLVLASAGMLMWLGVLVDEDMGAFDVPGLIVLGLDVLFFVLSLLFFGRVRWARPATSIVLHVVAAGSVVGGIMTMWTDDTVGVKSMAAGMALLAAGLSFVGILALHGSQMRCDLDRVLDPQEAATRRRKMRRIALVLGGLVVLALSWVAWRVVPLLLAEPTVSVDYLAQANQISKPADYDPNLNAAPYYEKLFAGLVPLPDELEEHWKAWPADLTAEHRSALDEWASSQEASLQTLAAAAQCPYWWYELTSEDGALSGIKMPYTDEMRRCAWAIILLAKYRASQGQVEAAITELMDLHMLGLHRVRGGTLVEQLSGVAVCALCYDALLAVLDRCTADTGLLRPAQKTLEVRVSQLRVPRFEEVERLYGYDSIQRSFSDDGHGNGRLIPRQLYDTKKDGSLYSPPLSYAGAVWICATHPDRAQTVRLFNERWQAVSILADQSPWELHSRGVTCETRMDELLQGNYYLHSSAGPMARCIEIGWRSHVHGRAVVAILAILTWKAEKGQWPNSLQDLVTEGYLQEVPMDPYSDEPLVYKVTGDNFTLYSVAGNFLDDGGEAVGWDLSEWGGDRVFWPVARNSETTMDDEP